jgi:hypothetical protein
LPSVQKALAGKESANPFALLYDAADAVISTSVAEGYGYSLFEPWCFGIPVAGRLPDGAGFIPGMKTESFYRRFPIPVSWIDLEGMYRNYSDCYSGMFGRKYVSMKRFSSMVVKDGYVDFGKIGARQQLALIRRMLQNESTLASLHDVLQKRTEGWPGIDAIERIDRMTVKKNGEIVRHWSDFQFDPLFVKCFNRRPGVVKPLFWYRKIGRFFRASRNFYPLVPIK